MYFIPNTRAQGRIHVGIFYTKHPRSKTHSALLHCNKEQNYIVLLNVASAHRLVGHHLKGTSLLCCGGGWGGGWFFNVKIM